MKTKPRYVFDTNVVVSALLFENSSPGKAFYAGLECGELLLSTATVLELRELLRRKKFDRYLTPEQRDQFLVLLLPQTTVVEIVPDVRPCRASNEDKLLELRAN